MRFIRDWRALKAALKAHHATVTRVDRLGDHLRDLVRKP